MYPSQRLQQDEEEQLKTLFMKPFRCAPCIRVVHIASTLENMEYLYRKYPKTIETVLHLYF